MSGERCDYARAGSGYRAAPGGPNFRAASSRTSTQSRFSPASGGENVCSPVFGNSPMDVAFPVRGLNHHAFTFLPLILSIRTAKARPAGASNRARKEPTPAIVTSVVPEGNAAFNADTMSGQGSGSVIVSFVGAEMRSRRGSVCPLLPRPPRPWRLLPTIAVRGGIRLRRSLRRRS